MHNVYEIASLFELNDVDCGLLLTVYGETRCILLASYTLLNKTYISKLSTYFKLVLKTITMIADIGFLIPIFNTSSIIYLYNKLSVVDKLKYKNSILRFFKNDTYILKNLIKQLEGFKRTINYKYSAKFNLGFGQIKYIFINGKLIIALKSADNETKLYDDSINYY